jgi:hypothetical protein
MVRFGHRLPLPAGDSLASAAGIHVPWRAGGPAPKPIASSTEATADSSRSRHSTHHLAFVAAHAVAASVALLAGLAALRRPRLIGLHAASTLATTGLLAGALWLGDRANLVIAAAVAPTVVGQLLVRTARRSGTWLVLDRGGTDDERG